VNVKNNPYISAEFKYTYNEFDFVMIQYGVSMDRNLDTDMVVISNVPAGVKHLDVENLQKDL
jgi:hypothetical protein